MHNPVLYALRKVLHKTHYETLAFNFRGVGLSAGKFSGGQGEEEDLQGVLRWVQKEIKPSFLGICGYSFGAQIGLSVSQKVAVDGLVLVGVPVTQMVMAPQRLKVRAMFCLQGEKDEFGDPQMVRDFFQHTQPMPEVIPIPASNHFFDNHLEDLTHAFSSLCERFTTSKL